MHEKMSNIVPNGLIKSDLAEITNNPDGNQLSWCRGSKNTFSWTNCGKQRVGTSNTDLQLKTGEKILQYVTHLQEKHVKGFLSSC